MDKAAKRRKKKAKSPSMGFLGEVIMEERDHVSKRE